MDYTYTIFSIDDEADEQMRARFVDYIAQQDTYGNLIQMRGCYNGTEENSFICYTRDFNEFVHGMGYIDNQESWLEVSGGKVAHATLVFNDEENTRNTIGRLVSTDSETAKEQLAWTYRPDQDTYYIVKPL